MSGTRKPKALADAAAELAARESILEMDSARDAPRLKPKSKKRRGTSMPLAA
jgi:hypothetical protein